MDLKWGSKEAWKFYTNVGLITTRDKKGKDNILACEWTHVVSYTPWLIAVCIGKSKKSAENIIASKEFVVNIASEKQNEVSSIAGGNSSNEVDKISVLKDLGYKFEKGEKVKALRLSGSSLIAECKLVRTIADLGSHDIFIGEVVESKIGDAQSLVYHEGKYWKRGENIPKPDEKEMQRINKAIEKNKIA